MNLTNRCLKNTYFRTGQRRLHPHKSEMKTWQKVEKGVELQILGGNSTNLLTCFSLAPMVSHRKPPPVSKKLVALIAAAHHHLLTYGPVWEAGYAHTLELWLRVIYMNLTFTILPSHPHVPWPSIALKYGLHTWDPLPSFNLRMVPSIYRPAYRHLASPKMARNSGNSNLPWFPSLLLCLASPLL